MLGRFVAETAPTDLPQDLLHLAKLRLIDTIGAMLVGAGRPWSLAVADHSAAMGGGPCTVVRSPQRCSPPMAALANGNMAHADELDDVHDQALSHPGAVVVPAALAVAEARGSSGADLLAAIVLGYELTARAGVGVGAVSHMLRGFYPTGTGGVFGATAAAGKLLGLDPHELAQAFGIAGSFAGGIVEYAQSGGAVKWLHAGRAAEGGVTAAYLARNGFTGPTTVLEGRFGFCKVFSDAPEPERLLNGLGSEFAIRVVAVKPYACCSDMHPVIDALLQLRSVQGITIDDVSHVEVGGPVKLVELNDLDGTRSILAAKYSVPLTAGIALSRDIRDPWLYDDRLLTDETLRSFQDRVRLSVAQDINAVYPRVIAARVTVETKDGRVMSAECLGALGTVHRPLSEAQILEKFRINAGPVITQERAEEIVDRVQALEREPHIDRLTSILY